MFAHLLNTYDLECITYTFIVVRQLAEVTTGADNLS